MTRLLVTVVIGIIVAALSFSSAIGGILRLKQPEIATSMWPVNGFAYGRQAELVLASSITTIQEKPSDASRSLIKSLSQQAFLMEPFATSVVRNLALEQDYAGDREGARAVMQMASKLTRRDLVANIWLVEDYAKSNDTAAALEFYDQSLRTSSEAEELLIPNLQLGLKDTRFIDPMVEVLSKQPPWALEFWTNVGRIPEAVLNASALRRKLQEKGYQNPQSTDQFLITSLLRASHFEEAEQLFYSLSGKSLARERAVLKNSDFSVGPVFTPFQWQTFFEDQYEAEIDTNSKSLNISTFADGGGLVARQLFQLKPGSYDLLAQQENWQPENSDAIYVEIYCAERKQAKSRAMKVNLDKREISHRFEQSDTQCRYFWIDVIVRPRPDQRDYQGTITDLSINPTTG